MAYRQRVQHEKLGKARIVTAGDLALLEERANALYITWDNEWRQKKARQDTVDEKQKARLRSLSNKHEAEESARRQAEELKAEQNAIESILKQTIAHSYACDWELLKTFDPFGKASPVRRQFQPASSPPPVLPEVYAPSFLEKLLPPLRKKREEINAVRYSNALANWQQVNSRIHEENLNAQREVEREYEIALKLHMEAEVKHQEEQASYNRMVDQRRELFFARDPDALVEYWYALFADQPHPDQWPQECSLDYQQE